MSYSLAQFVSEINSLGTETVYPYASLSGHSTSSCKLVSVDSNSGAIKFTRNGGAQVEKISGANVSKLVEALATNKAVEMNSLFGGSGNARSVLEAFVVHTPHVFLCKINGKKHIYYSHDKSHPSGQIEIDTRPNVPVYSGSAAVRKTDDLGLVVGMQSEASPYGVVTIVDDDDYSYQVLCVNDSKHSKGIRTISKILVKEWIDAVTSDPNKNASTIRGDLCGKSDIDKFEYGNEGVLIKLAKMATGQSPYTMVDVSEYWERRLGRSEKPMLSTSDLLSVALKMFAEKRKEEDTVKSGWFSSGIEVNAKIREYFAGLTDAKLQAFTVSDIEELFVGKKNAANNIVFKPMWSGGLNAGWSDLKPYVLAHGGDVSTFISQMKNYPTEAAVFYPSCPKDSPCSAGTRPPGMGPSVISELLMKFHPDSYFKHGRVTHEVLTSLKLIDFPYKSNYSDTEYKQVCGAAAKIRDKMKAMKLPRQINADGTEDNAPPDYLTVNEFIWFVNEYKDTISKECEAKMMKKADYSQASSKPAGKKPKVDFGNAEDVVLLRLAAALRAKPFAILAGHSGTGKSRMVRKLAYMTCAKGGYKALLEGADGKPAATPGNFCMVQVKPNWHDSTDLLGYYSEIRSAFRSTDFVKFICKAYAYPDVPFFVCLDEMNLAPVEQYFAEYLSAIESRKVKDDAEFLDDDGNAKTGPKVITDTLLDKSVWKSASDLGCEFTQSAYWVEKHGLTIPRNLFVVGTVNMDESTNQFSRKVLDRAFTLEMTDADFEHFGEQSPEPSYDDYAGDDFVEELLAGKLFASDLTADHKLKPSQVANLNKLKPILADSSFVVAYRFANEYALYEDALEKMLPQFDSSTGAGGESAEAASPSAKPEAFDDMILMKLLPRITGDAELVLKIFTGKEDAQLDDADVKGLAGLLEKKGASFKKMKEIVKRGGTSLTFWP